MAFSTEFINKVLEANDIVDVIGQDAQLKGRGSQFMGLCPFPNHKERTPSFSVNQDKQVYHCFGCKESGNLVTYLKVIRGMNFPEAIEFLANRAGIPVPVEEQLSPQAENNKDKRKVFSKINEVAALFFHRQLLTLTADHPVREYLAKRGIEPEAVALFQIGYAPDSWESLTEFLNSQKISLPMSQELGLVKARKEGKSGFFDIFRHRLIFPIVSPSGNYIGFGGRVLKDEQPKYLNSPESEIFHKGKILYGLNETAKYIRSEDQAIVVEGYTDFLALYMAGVKNVVATLGTALTENHAKLLRRYTKNILVLFDGDNAGQMASERSLPILLAQGLYPKAFSLPDKQDPDEFIKSAGVEAFKQKASEAPDLFIQILEEKARHVGSEASDKVKILDEVGPILKGMMDLRLQDLYISEMALRMNVAPNWIKKSMAQEAKAAHQQNHSGAGVAARSNPGQNNYQSQTPRNSNTANSNSPPWASNENSKNPSVGGSNPAHAPSSASNSNISAVQPVNTASSPNQPLQVSKIQLKGATKVELWLVNAALINEDGWRAVEASGVEEYISHEGILQLIKRIGELDRQMPNKFDSLTSLLLAEVDPPGALALHLDPSFQLSDEGVQKMIQDCVVRIKANSKKAELLKMRGQLRNKKGSDSLKDLEQIMNIHRGKKSLDSET